MGNMCEAHHPWSLRGQTGICNPSPNWWAHQKHTEGNLTLECEMCWNSRHLSGDGCLRRHYYLDFLHVSACRRFFWWCQRAERRLFCARGVSSLRFYWKAAWVRNGIVILWRKNLKKETKYQILPSGKNNYIMHFMISRNHSIKTRIRDLNSGDLVSMGKVDQLIRWPLVLLCNNQSGRDTYTKQILCFIWTLIIYHKWKV